MPVKRQASSYRLKSVGNFNTLNGRATCRTINQRLPKLVSSGIKRWRNGGLGHQKEL
jgi:hypothetical protein